MRVGRRRVAEGIGVSVGVLVGVGVSVDVGVSVGVLVGVAVVVGVGVQVEGRPATIVGTIVAGLRGLSAICGFMKINK